MKRGYEDEFIGESDQDDNKRYRKQEIEEKIKKEIEEEEKLEDLNDFGEIYKTKTRSEKLAEQYENMRLEADVLYKLRIADFIKTNAPFFLKATEAAIALDDYIINLSQSDVLKAVDDNTILYTWVGNVIFEALDYFFPNTFRREIKYKTNRFGIKIGVIIKIVKNNNSDLKFSTDLSMFLIAIDNFIARIAEKFNKYSNGYALLGDSIIGSDKNDVYPFNIRSSLYISLNIITLEKYKKQLLIKNKGEEFDNERKIKKEVIGERINKIISADETAALKLKTFLSEVRNIRMNTMDQLKKSRDLPTIEKNNLKKILKKEEENLIGNLIIETVKEGGLDKHAIPDGYTKLVDPIVFRDL